MTWKITTSAIAVLTISACGGDDATSKGASDPMADAAAAVDDSETTKDNGVACDSLDAMPELPSSEIAYPDSVCADGTCQQGGCDPLGRCSPSCNAWRVFGEVSFQAAPMSGKLDLGFPTPPSRADDDICSGTGFMTSPTGVEVNCCQRADNLTAKQPMLKLTGLKMSRPQTFALPVVTGLNKMAIEYDLYNSVLGLSSNVDGDLTVTMGSSLPNRDGSFFPIAGPFKSAGETFNDDGSWDAQVGVKGMLSTGKDGRQLHVGPSSADKDLNLLLWFDDKLDFVRLALPLRGVEYDLPMSDDLGCAGARNPGGTFELVGKLSAYLPLEGARKTSLYVSRSEGGASNLCTFTSAATGCAADVSKWSK